MRDAPGSTHPVPARADDVILPGERSPPPVSSYLVLATVNLVLGGLAFLLGMLILRENAWQRLNRVVALMLFFGGFGSLLAALGFLGTSGAGAQTQVNPIQSLAYLWEFFFPSMFLFASLFPTERRFARRPFQGRYRFWPTFELLCYLPHLVHFIVLLGIALWKPALGHGTGVLGLFGTLAKVGGLFVDLFLAVHQALFSLVNLGFGVGAVMLLADSYRRARVPRVRMQVGVIGAGLTLCLLLYSLSTLLPTLFGVRRQDTFRSTLVAAALAIGSASIAWAMVRYKFLDARLLARRGILYSLASTLVIVVYLVLVQQVNKIVTSITRIDARVVEPVFLIVALVLFQPLLSRLEQLLDRLFLRDPGDYRNVLRQLGRELLGTLDLETLLTRSTRTIAEAMLLRNARIAAFARGRVMVQCSSGDTLEAGELQHLRAALVRLPVGQETLRVAEGLDGLDEQDHALIERRLGTALVLPLRAGGELVGALLLGPRVTGTEFTSEDVALLQALATQMSVSMQNALLVRDREQAVRLEQELQLAQQIQRSFLMTEFPILPRFEVHGVMLPSKEVGGDFYDLVPLANGEFVVAIADVAGKGVPAALLSSMLQASLRTQAASIKSVSEILRNINALVYRGTAVHQFATFFLARVHSAGLEMSFSNAGHNYPVILKPDGRHVTLERGGTVLGILEGVEYEEERIVLAAGDRLVLYTDGLTEAEAPDGEMFGEDRLYALLHGLPHDLSARAMAERILEEHRRFIAGGDARDDTTLMVLRVLEPEPSPREGVTRDVDRESAALEPTP
jgi:serine phosphatase RsbU (regulator of sigma subunit)